MIAADRPLRPYQVEACDAIDKTLAEHRTALLVLPTGTGKTRVFSEILRRRMAQGSALVLAHREELLEQAKASIERDAGLTCEIEQADRFASSFFGKLPDVVIGSVQTLRTDRMKRFSPDSFHTLVIDEAHHAPAVSYRKIIEYFAPARVLGVTATPDRGDKVGLGNIFEACAYEYSLRDAIEDEWLVPIRQRAILCPDLDISMVRSSYGDLSEKDLQQALTVDSVLHQIAAPLVDQAKARRTIVFVVGVEQAHALAAVLSTYAGASKVASIDGSTQRDLRREILSRYQRGDIQFLINCAVLTEGFDAPETACIGMARPTKSRALYTQCIGRGTRKAEGKEDLLVLDFVGNAGKHALVSCLDVLAGKPIPPEIARLASLKMKDAAVPVDVALAQAESEAEDRQRKREEERRRRHVYIKAQYKAVDINPFTLAGISLGDVGPRATPAQVAFIERLTGQRLNVTPSRREASRLIDNWRGGGTYKMRQVLARAGLNPNLPFAEASKAISYLKEHHFRPREVPEKWTATIAR